MKKKFVTKSLISMIIVLIVGFVLIFSSNSIGEYKGHKAIASNGGGMDTAQYARIVESTTSNFRTVGLVLSLIGGFGVLISGYAFYKELE